MALYHFHVEQIKRSEGYTAIAAAAYRSGQKLYDDYYGETQDYTHKGGVVMSEIILPPHAPERYADRQTLWTELEYAEKHPRAQLAYSFDIALQNELTMDENIALARKFIRDNFTAKGMVCDWAVHEPDKGENGIPNPHFHVIAPIRPLDERGRWGAKQHRVYELDGDKKRIRDGKGGYVFSSMPTTDWREPETLNEWRKNWADMVNSKFAEKGIKCRIDHRSYEEQGLDIIPQVHEGAAVRHMEEKGIRTEKGAWNRWVKKTYTALRSIRGALDELSSWIADAKQELKKEKTPTVVQFVNEYYDSRDKVADSYKVGRQKAKSTNLKQRAEICNYLMEHNITTAVDLENLIADREAEAERIDAKIKPRTEELKRLQNKVKMAEDYQKYKPIFEQTQKIFFKSKKENFQAEHRKELNSFQKARRELAQIVPDGGIPQAQEAWQARIGTLTDEIASTLSKAGKDRLDGEIKMLKKIRRAVDYGLEKRGDGSSGKENNRESNGILGTASEEKVQASVIAKLKENQEKIRRRDEANRQIRQAQQKQHGQSL